MARKPIKLKLSYPHLNMQRDFRMSGPDDPNNQVYRVEQVDQTTEFKPGQQLLESAVRDMCKDDRHYAITMVPAKQ